MKMKTQAQWEEDGRKEKMMFKDYTWSQEAWYVTPVSILLPGEGQQPIFPFKSQVEWNSVTLADTQEERNRERCLAHNHDDYGAMIHIWWRKNSEAQRGCSAFPRSHSW